MKKLLCIVSLSAILLGTTVPAMAAVVSENDSTQPRGAPEGEVNVAGQSLDPITEGFRAPARFDGEITPNEDSKNPYRDWVGSIMANAMRDPGFMATLNVANQDLINFINSLNPADRAAFLAANKLPTDAGDDLLPVAADLCLRCHTPAGWLEGHSEPQTDAFPFLDGQFWGAAFPEEPVDGDGNPKPFDITVESEAEMEGVQCDFCHRAYDNMKRESLYDGSKMAAGNGGFFVETTNPFDEGDGLTEVPRPLDHNTAFQKSSFLCGTCHDVTNPFIKTRNEIDGAIPDMLHPLERTYTEWFWSGFRGKKTCQDCHKPMRFVGAQSWLLYPGLDMLWGDVDQKWIDRGINLTTSKSDALRDGMRENRRFMKSAARMQFVNSAKKAAAGDEATVTVRVTNNAGHKLPTGYGEGRQMWIHIKAVDKKGDVFFEDGMLNADGSLQRTALTKVYEQKIEAEGYDSSVIAEGDEEFHFVLLNNIVKDNRIPPKGYNKAAYQADGAFIVPANLYADGQNWDDTDYSFTIPADVKGNVKVTATLYYQTFNKEYIDFLHDQDVEPTQKDGGRARNLPAGGNYADSPTWGAALHELWHDVGNGPPVKMKTAKFEIEIE